MTKPPLPPEILIRCREMRKNATNAEDTLWQLLRNRQLLGYKFRRQYPIDSYIADFCCVEAKLVIEVDGGGHNEPAQGIYDQNRTEDLEAEGFRVIRFINQQIQEDPEKALQEIAVVLCRIF